MALVSAGYSDRNFGLADSQRVGLDGGQTSAVIRTLSFLLLASLGACAASSAAMKELGPVSFLGSIDQANDIGAIAAFERWLLIASDEGGQIQLLERADDGNTYNKRLPAIRPLGSDEEIDLEGLARQGNRVYALGSHSQKRPLLKPEATHEENRRRIMKLEAPSSRFHLFRLTFDPRTGDLAAPIERISLRDVLLQDRLLWPFSRIPGKENGVDLEGIALDGAMLLVGFRSPVLRSGHVPVLVFSFESPERYELRFIDLDGRGIRDLVGVEGGFLVLAGRDAPAAGGFELYFWDGVDRIPDRGRPRGHLTSLGAVPAPAGGEAEGITVLHETGEAYEVLVVYDGVDRGGPRRFRVSKP